MSEIQPADVKEYWEKVADQFDAIYSGEKNALMRLMDRIFRKDMYDRYRLTIEECSPPSIRSVLDVGTGSGRFCLPLAEKKDRIVGIDWLGGAGDSGGPSPIESGLPVVTTEDQAHAVAAVLDHLEIQ